MKQDIHPKYQFVVYKDTSSDFAFLGRSTQTSDETIEWEDGNSYPLISIEISSASHPFYTGKQTLVDSAGRVERFRRRYNIKTSDATDSDDATDTAVTADTAAEGSSEAAD